MHRGEDLEIMLKEENQLDVIEWFIALVICSTCFGHLYAHHTELETILVLLPHMVCNALVADGRRSGAGQQAVCLGWGKLLEQFPSSRTLHTICGNNTSVVSSSWWWAYKCPKHVEQITSAINHSVVSSSFSSRHIYNNAQTNIHQSLKTSTNFQCFIGPWQSGYEGCIGSRSLIETSPSDSGNLGGRCSQPTLPADTQTTGAQPFLRN